MPLWPWPGRKSLPGSFQAPRRTADDQAVLSCRTGLRAGETANYSKGILGIATRGQRSRAFQDDTLVGRHGCVTVIPTSRQDAHEHHHTNCYRDNRNRSQQCAPRPFARPPRLWRSARRWPRCSRVRRCGWCGAQENVAGLDEPVEITPDTARVGVNGSGAVSERVSDVVGCRPLRQA